MFNLAIASLVYYEQKYLKGRNCLRKKFVRMNGPKMPYFAELMFADAYTNFNLKELVYNIYILHLFFSSLKSNKKER